MSNNNTRNTKRDESPKRVNLKEFYLKNGKTEWEQDSKGTAENARAQTGSQAQETAHKESGQHNWASGGHNQGWQSSEACHDGRSTKGKTRGSKERRATRKTCRVKRHGK